MTSAEQTEAIRQSMQDEKATIERLTRDEARLRKALAECAAYTGGHADGATVDFLMHVPENVRLHVERLKADHEHEVEDLCSTANANLESMLKQKARADAAEAKAGLVFDLVDALKAIRILNDMPATESTQFSIADFCNTALRKAGAL